MFRKAAESVVENCGTQTLHAVTDLNSAERFKPLCVVQKKASFWPFKKPLMIPTFVKITDLLKEDVEMSLSNREFTLLKQYNELPVINVGGSFSSKIADELKVDVKGNEKLKLVLKLGDIEKVEVPWQKLHKVLEKNIFNCDDQVYKNAKGSRMSLCVVIESICTKGDGSVQENKSQSGSADVDVDVSKLVKTAIVPEVHTKGSIERKDDKSCVIPPNTVLAYSCVEFSVSSSSFANLHAMHDVLDNEPGEMLADYNYKNKQTCEDHKVAIAKIKAEFQPLINSKDFMEFHSKLKLLFADANTVDYRVMAMLLHAATVRIVDQSDEKSISISALSHFVGCKIDSPWDDVMKVLGFSVPKDTSDGSASIEFPANDDSGMVKSCTGLLDSVMDISPNALKLLAKISTSHIGVLLNVVRDHLGGKDIDLKSSAVRSLIHADPLALNFLTDSGFLKLHEENKLVYTDNPSNLLDIYAVLYVLSVGP